MIVKLIQNLEIKMDSQINSLEARIERMQERFNKDLEEIKKNQYIMNNAINAAGLTGHPAWGLAGGSSPGLVSSLGLPQTWASGAWG